MDSKYIPSCRVIELGGKFCLCLTISDDTVVIKVKQSLNIQLISNIFNIFIQVILNMFSLDILEKELIDELGEISGRKLCKDTLYFCSSSNN